jgi:hypothetical protein
MRLAILILCAAFSFANADTTLVVVIDRSDAVKGDRFVTVKDAIVQVAKTLDAADQIAVVTLDGAVAMKARRAGDHAEIEKELNKLAIDNRKRDTLAALKQANTILAPAKTKVRHVLVFAGGTLPSDGVDAYARTMGKAKITASAVGIGGADRNVLQLISEGGEGRLYMVEDLSALAKVFVKELREAAKQP